MPSTARAIVAAAFASLMGASLVAMADDPPPAARTATAAKPAGDAELKSKGSYSLGLTIGEQLRRDGITSSTLASQRFLAGLEDAIGGKAKWGPADQEKALEFVRAAHDRLGDANHAAAKAFLAQNGKAPGVTTTASGLEYKVLKAGTGESPKSTDTVTVNYRGTLLDGTEFDSSYKRNEPATFPLNGVIPGWREALSLMKPGGKSEVWIPPQLAYDVNSPPSIPPGSLLKFEIELLSAKPTPPAPAGGANGGMGGMGGAGKAPANGGTPK